MAVAHSAASESHAATTGSVSQTSFSWTHTQTGTPQGVLVFVHVANSTGNPVSSVTYGGVTLERVSGGAAIDSAGEAGRTDLFFAGSGLGTGNQTVTVNRANTTDIMYASAATVTAATDTNVTGIVLLQGDGALTVQSVTDGGAPTNSLRYAAAYSGLASPPPAGTGSTLLNSIDFGNYGIALVRETTAGTGARNVGFNNATTDDRAAVHVAVRELWNRTDTETVGAFTLTGNDATLEKRTPAVLSVDVGKFFLPERNFIRNSEQFDNAYWNKNGIGAALAPAVTADNTAAPDGTLTADRIVFDTNGSTTVNDRSDLDAGVSTPSVIGKTYIFSVWLKTTDGSSVTIQLSHTGVAANYPTVTGTWQRFTSLSNTAGDTARRPRLSLRVGTPASAYASLHVWGFQWEEGTSITDYDPTGAAGATDATLRQTYRLDGGVGAFTFTGRAADTLHNARIEGGTGAFAFTGNDATLTEATPKAITVETGVFTLTGNPAAVTRGYAITAETGAFTAAGQPATLLHNPRIEANTGSFALSGGAPALLRGRYLSGGAGEFIETGQPATFRRTWAIQAGTGAFSFTGNPASLTELGAYEIDPIVGAFALSGQPANLAQSRSLTVGAGTFAYTGQPAILRQSQALSVDAGGYSLTGQQVAAKHGCRINVNSAIVTLTGNDAALAAGGGAQLAVDLGSFALTGRPASFSAMRRIVAGVGAFNLIGNAAGLADTDKIVAGVGSFALAGNSITLTKAGTTRRRNVLIF